MPMVIIRPYDAERDEDAVFALWQTTLGRQWPLAAAAFQKIITGSPQYQADDHFVARRGEQIAGFVAAQVNRDDPGTGGIPVLCVDPEFQRQGVGTALHEAALAHLRARGAARLQLGVGYSYFWPGVPDNLPAAKPFFQARGWDFDEPCYDLAQRMQDYRSPKDSISEIALELAAPEDVPALLDFEWREFPNWLGAFQSIADIGDFGDLLIARDRRSPTIIGSLILYSHHSHPSRVDGIWKELLGDPLGEIGCVGVAADAHNRGIGSALVARGSEILKQRGVEAVHIGWVYRVNFYGRLGYAKWRMFHMSWRNL